jgi:nucleoside-diphosphate-sugar epimerase
MKQNILITGANGEVGHGLITALAKKANLVTLDIKPLDKKLASLVKKTYTGDILNKKLVKEIFRRFDFETVYHLAALLSTSAEKNPAFAQTINVTGTVNLLDQAILQSQKRKKIMKFVFPSSIAVYGLPDLPTKEKTKKIKEIEYLNPITMYGINKLYCEKLGIYYSNYYQLLANSKRYIDFRCVRFPGLISADTMPTGGTSDFAPEMLHAAAQGKNYICFVRPDTTIPFMAMPDAIKSLLQLTESPRKNLKNQIYNVDGFSASAKEIELIIKKSYLKFKMSYKVDKMRQRIVDTWPTDVDNSLARRDWNWKPEFNFINTFTKYLIPSAKLIYSGHKH